MGCTENKSDDEGNDDGRRRRSPQRHYYQEEEESVDEEEEFKDFEELGSKYTYFNKCIFKCIFYN